MRSSPDPSRAAARYRAELTARFSRYQASTAALHAALLPHPAAVAAVARTLTAPPIGRLLAGGWALYWNDLLEGATPGSPRAVAALAERVARGLTGAGATRRWFRDALAPNRDDGRAVVEAVAAR